MDRSKEYLVLVDDGGGGGGGGVFGVGIGFDYSDRCQLSVFRRKY